MIARTENATMPKPSGGKQDAPPPSAVEVARIAELTDATQAPRRSRKIDQRMRERTNALLERAARHAAPVDEDGQ